MRRGFRSALSIALALGGCFVASLATAQSFPSRPVRIIVGFSPGGASDVSARLVAERMSEEWKQPVVVENRPGAGTTVAAALVAAAPADGYTILLISPGTHATSAALYKNLTYDGLKSFAGVGLIARAPFVAVVPASSKYQSMKDLIDRARANPEQVTYSTGGAGTGPHLVTEVIGLATKVKFLHVPFRGSAPATTAVLGEEVEFSMADTSAIPHIDSGKLRALAVTTAKRSALLPDTPTVAETVVPDFAYPLTVGLAVAAGTPRAIVTQINGSLNRALANENTRSRLKDVGFEAASSTPEEFAALLATEMGKYGKIVQDIGLKID